MDGLWYRWDVIGQQIPMLKRCHTTTCVELEILVQERGNASPTT